jgi:hypothetical protein
LFREQKNCSVVTKIKNLVKTTKKHEEKNCVVFCRCVLVCVFCVCLWFWFLFVFVVCLCVVGVDYAVVMVMVVCELVWFCFVICLWWFMVMGRKSSEGSKGGPVSTDGNKTGIDTDTGIDTGDWGW